MSDIYKSFKKTCESIEQQIFDINLQIEELFQTEGKSEECFHIM